MREMEIYTKWKCEKIVKTREKGKNKRIEYCFGKGLELLSASLVLAVCQDSKVFRIGKFPCHLLWHCCNFAQKNPYCMNHEVMSARSVFQVKFTVEFTSLAMYFSSIA